MATSGTVGATTFQTRQVIDHALRRCRLTPQQIVPEHIQSCTDLLWLILSTWTSKGLALWCIDRTNFGLTAGRTNITLPVGTLDVLNVNLRQVTSLPGTVTGTGGLGNNYTLALDSATQVTQVGIQPSLDCVQCSYVIQVSTDGGANYVTQVTNTNVTLYAGQRYWYDISSSTNVTHVRALAGSADTLTLSSITAANNPSDVPLALVDRDTYYALSNNQFLGRPTQYWYNRKRAQPELVLWPAPLDTYVSTFFLATALHRQIQDVGTLPQELELPQRWYLAAVCELARHAARELKEVDGSLIPMLDADAAQQLSIAWDGETDRAPVRLMPNIRGYTA